MTTNGIDELRRAVKVFGGCNESFLQRFTAEELIAIYRVHKHCKWDIYPHGWSDRQVREALKGKVPVFRETPRGLVPVYAKRKQWDAAEIARERASWQGDLPKGGARVLRRRNAGPGLQDQDGA